jgi:Cu2+-exporting ATPase
MTSVVLNVEGMFSVFEALGVEKRLRKHRGIRRVEANFLSGTTTVVYEDAEVRLDEIVQMIHDCGYRCPGECLPEHLCAPAVRGGR